MGGCNDYTDMGGNGFGWPSTHRSLVYLLRGLEGPECDSAFEQIAQRYWKPVYCWILRRGYNHEDAKDLTQDFFISFLTKEKLRQIDPAPSGLRAFLLAGLKDFIEKTESRKRPKPNTPRKPTALIDEFDGDQKAGEVSRKQKPEDGQDRLLPRELLLRVLVRLKKECVEAGRERHYEIFCKGIINPELDATPAPSIDTLADECHLAKWQTATHLYLANLRFRQLVRQQTDK